MGTLKGITRDGSSGASVEAKVHVLTSAGRFVHPADSILKVGPGDPFFYCPGSFTVNVPGGSTDIVVERGTEYEPLRKVVSMPRKGCVEVELPLKRWTDLPSNHWYPGNTHLHYNEEETRPNDRLRLDPQAKAGELSEDDVVRISNHLDKEVLIEGPLRRKVQQEISRLRDIRCYRGLRHRRGLPVRGQRTRTNARTRKGVKKTVAGRKGVKDMRH